MSVSEKLPSEAVVVDVSLLSRLRLPLMSRKTVPSAMKPSMPLEVSCRASLLLFLLEYSILSNLLKPGILPRKGVEPDGRKTRS